MTRIIAIVVVIAAAVIAYMYTSAGDVAIDRDIEATSTQPADGDAHAEVTDVPLDTVAEGLEDDHAEVIEDAPLEEAAEDAAIEGPEGTEELEAVTETEVLDDTAEPAAGEVGLADEEPNEGVGAVSTEEETDGAALEGIIAEEGEQDGLPGEITEEAADEGAVAAEEPEALIPADEAAADPEAVIVADPASDEAVVVVPETEAEAAVEFADPGPALRTEPAAANLDTLFDQETFDLNAVAAAIEGSDLDTALKAQLRTALVTAADQPALLPEVLTRIREALLGAE